MMKSSRIDRFHLLTLASILCASFSLGAQQPAAKPVRVGGQVKPPERVKNVLPIRPSDAPKDDEQRIAILELTISPKGTVESVKVFRSVEPKSLVQAAIAAAKQWEYKPTMLNGRAVPVIYNVVVDFECAFTGCGPALKK